MDNPTSSPVIQAHDLQIIHPSSEAAWLELRAKDLTSTEVSALFGLSPWATLFEVWHRKKSAAVVTISDNERVTWGQRLQDAIAFGVAQDKGWAIRKMTEYIRIPSLRLGASFDFRVQRHPYLLKDGDNPVVPFPHENGRKHESDSEDDGLLEIKNVDALIYRDKWSVDEDGTVEAPPHIEVQVQHQLLVSGLKRATIGALIGGNKVVIIPRERDEKIINAIKVKAAAFWKSIDDNAEPKPDFSRDADFISQLYGFADPGKLLTLANSEESKRERITKLVQEYRALGAAAKTAEEGEQEAKAELLTLIGDCEKVVGDGFSISAGMVGPAHVEYDREGYRSFRVTVKKTKETTRA